MEDDKALSEGEGFLEEFFLDEQIRYVAQKEIPKLQGDYSAYRIADFYLPRLKLYVEFLGLWNAGKDYRAKYIEKMKVYELNKIPCIYIYPENLGAIKYIFNYRVKAVLEKHQMGRQLFRFNLFRWRQIYLTNLLVILCIVGYFLHLSGILPLIFYQVFVYLLAFLCYLSAYQMIEGAYYFLIRESLRKKKTQSPRKFE